MKESTLEKLNRLKKEAQQRSKNLNRKDASHSDNQLSSSLSSEGLGDQSKLSFLNSHASSSMISNSDSMQHHSSLTANSFQSVGARIASSQINSAKEMTTLECIQEENKAPENNIISVVKERPKSTQTTQRRRLMVRGKSYTLLNHIGRGGSSVVYQAFSDADAECVAIKCVDVSNADECVKNAYENEIKLLKDLQGSPYVIKMFDYEKRNNRLYVVMERGDVDLATFMQKRHQQIDDKFIKYHWQEMLRCVKVIHDRNIVHSDLKPANFLFVGASLKLIDFGRYCVQHSSNKTSVVKDIQIGTLNFMSPEAISGSDTSSEGSTFYKIPLKSDVWSLGCILYAMVYGRTPFQLINNQIAKIRAICESKIEYGPIKDQLLLDVMKRCLVRNVRERASVEELLNHDYLKN
uniref:Protein kinase domain-containing protein n=1 Tax=Ditylenchus dipsaci TaxID=166011 RepID=A0A915DGI3_9BILA